MMSEHTCSFGNIEVWRIACVGCGKDKEVAELEAANKALREEFKIIATCGATMTVGEVRERAYKILGERQ
jgi:hypothetical protein